MRGKLIQGDERASTTIRESDSVICGRTSWWPEKPEQDFAMAAKEIAVKKYVVKLDEAERARLQALINKGKSPAKRLLKARILLKADVSEHGEGWSDGQIINALDTNMSMVTRVRQQLVEEGLEAVLSRN